MKKIDYKIINGDCLGVMREMGQAVDIPHNSIDRHLALFDH